MRERPRVSPVGPILNPLRDSGPETDVHGFHPWQPILNPLRDSESLRDSIPDTPPEE